MSAIGERVFVSHAAADLSLVQELFSTVKNFPFATHVALEEVESGQSRAGLKGRIANCNVLVAVLTDESRNSNWIHQEVGYAVARGVPVLPLYDRPELRTGYLADIEGVEIDRENPSITVFNLLCRLRSVLAPLGALSVPNWFITFPCDYNHCGHPIVLDIDRGQTDLWKLHDHGQLLSTSCEHCGATYYFDAATIGFIRREEPQRRSRETAAGGQ